MTAGRRILLGLVALLATAGVLIGLLSQPERVPEERVQPGAAVGSMTGVSRPRSQAASVREWKRFAFHRIASIGGVGEAPLTMPLHVRTDRAGCVYILDWGERCVKKFDTAGELLMQYGHGEGNAPGEFANLSDFDVAEDGSVWACDPLNNLITVFHEDGSVRTTVRPERPPHRIALVRGDTCVVMSAPVGGRMFQLYEPGGRMIGECGVLMDQQLRLGIALDGRLVATGIGGFAFAAFRAGVFAVSTDAGDSIAVYRETLEHGGLPDVLVSRSGNAEYARTDPDAPVVTRSLSCVDGELHLLRGAHDRPSNAVMDVYDIHTGTYRYSYDLPADALAASVTRTLLVVVSDTTVTVWARGGGTSGRWQTGREPS